MNKPLPLALLATALSFVTSLGYSQAAEYVTEPAHDRATSSFSGANPLGLPSPGANYLRIISPTEVELARVTADGDTTWLFFQNVGNPPVATYNGPAASAFTITVNGGAPITPTAIGYRRRALYAPFSKSDLRVENSLFLSLPLASAIPDNAIVQANNNASLWPSTMLFVALSAPLRYSPAIHVNQVGYLPDKDKRAMVGYFLGHAGELQVPANTYFDLIDVQTGQSVYRQQLAPRPDNGWASGQLQYQQVLEANFTGYTTPGQYLLRVDGLGASLPFRISSGVITNLARAYALGLYHQRCGGDGSTVAESGNQLPFTRFVHNRCHTAAASVPNVATHFPSATSIKFIEDTLRGYSGAYDVQLFPSISRAANDLPTIGSLLIAIGRYAAGNADGRSANTLYFKIWDGVHVDPIPGGTLRVNSFESSFSSTRVTQLKNYLNDNVIWNNPNNLTGDQKRTIIDDPDHSFANSFGVRAIVSSDGMPFPDGDSTGDNPPQTAPRMQTISSILSTFGYPASGTIDVSKGHHDAGDYSKYTLNSPALVHALIFAADNFPNAGALDNLGIPESGDGIGDLLQLAKWEADFLLKMQDTDGSFYFLVYPQTREYELDKLPENGDPQIVFPKTSAATAAAVAALAEIGSSPKYISAYGDVGPNGAKRYRDAATAGWNRLIALIGANDQNKTAIYQKITHYGDDFTHDDELAWAAAALFAATGTDTYFQALRRWFPHPNAANGANGYTIQWLRDGDSTSLPSSGSLAVTVDYQPNTANTADISRPIYFRGFDISGNRMVEKNDTSARDANQIYEARAKLADIKQFLNQWAVSHPTAGDDPFLFDRVSALVDLCHATRKFGWIRMYSGYGCAIRDLGFAARSGRLGSGAFDSTTYPQRASYLSECNLEIDGAAADVRSRSENNAYGTSLPFEAKTTYLEGWYFSSDWAFDIAVSVAKALKDAQQPNSADIRALVENFNFEVGRNPVNMSFVTGLGWKQQHEIVHQYALNDTRVLPPSGIPLGNISDHFLVPGSAASGQLDPVFFPPIAGGGSSFALYDRWADNYNLQTEFVSFQSGRALATALLLACSGTGSGQPWQSAAASIVLPGIDTAALNTPAVAALNTTLDLSDATIVWELQGHDPSFGTFTPRSLGDFRLEAEAVKPDGRRVFAVLPSVLVYDPINGGTPYNSDACTLALFHLDGNYNDASTCSCLTSGLHLNSGAVTFARAAWPKVPDNNMVARFSNAGDELQAAIANSTVQNAFQNGGLTIDAHIYVRGYKAGNGTHPHLFGLRQDYNSQIDLYYASGLSPDAPKLYVNNAGAGAVLSNQEWNDHVTPNAWHNIRFVYKGTGSTAETTVYIDGSFSKGPITTPVAGTYGTDWILWIGNFDGDVDEVRISKTDRGPLPGSASCQ